MGGRIALGNGDHGQQFGLPKLVDAKQEAEKLLDGPVKKIAVREETADLLVEFQNSTCLEIFNSSSGYEGWECSSTNGLLVIAQGGGELAMWITDPPLV